MMETTAADPTGRRPHETMRIAPLTLLAWVGVGDCAGDGDWAGVGDCVGEGAGVGAEVGAEVGADAVDGGGVPPAQFVARPETVARASSFGGNDVPSHWVAWKHKYVVLLQSAGPQVFSPAL
mmetsp:Transcript_54499/g.169184  ORF Transcript_54499/g.169184 Transcript_54499/m.169184 type:complete len:122 (-) Transcript_54499:258-623(-)